MSRAFVKETDSVDVLPERPVSEHLNLVTPEGLAAIEREIDRLGAAHADALTAGDNAAIAAVARDLHYWTARRASAQVAPPPADGDAVQFGSTVTVRRDDGREQTFRIVGEDEAEPARGTLSHVSPWRGRCSARRSATLRRSRAVRWRFYGLDENPLGGAFPDAAQHEVVRRCSGIVPVSACEGPGSAAHHCASLRAAPRPGHACFTLSPPYDMAHSKSAPQTR